MPRFFCFQNLQLHHPVPKSRMGGSNEFCLFPYNGIAHDAYHIIFLNLKIDEIWFMLDLIYRDIFESDRKRINQWWLGFCWMEIGTEQKRKRFEQGRINRIAKSIRVNYLRKRWKIAFGDHDLNTARNFLKLMMLFMIFGTQMLNNSFVSDDEKITQFLTANPCEDYRLWAFESCFGQSNNPEIAKSEIILTIINSNSLYSKVLL